MLAVAVSLPSTSEGVGVLACPCAHRKSTRHAASARAGAAKLLVLLFAKKKRRRQEAIVKKDGGESERLTTAVSLLLLLLQTLFCAECSVKPGAWAWRVCVWQGWQHQSSSTIPNQEQQWKAHR